LRLHIVPLTLGVGTRLFEGVPPMKLEQVRSRGATLVTYVTYSVLSERKAVLHDYAGADAASGS